MKKFASILLSMLMATGAIAAASAETYTGTAQGIGEVSVTLTVEDGKITAAEVVGESETKGIGYEPCADGTFADAIVAAQGVDFDSISGATVTSNAVKDAAKKAMAAAGLIEAEDTTVTDTECDVVIVGAGGAGMTAALQAVDSGVNSVIIVEKGGSTGGNTSRATGGMNAAKTVYQDENEWSEATTTAVEKAIATAEEKYADGDKISNLTATVKEQFEAYKHVLSDMDGKEVIIRTLDIGADKQIGYFDLPKEDNPAMGMRALRICLTRPEIFRTQLRALFRASAYGKLGIMFPMVTSVWEVREAKKLCEEVKRDLKHEGIPYSEDVQIGIMIETPAAAINSDRLAKEVDFFSIGTNDLTQYTLACDRQNNDLGRFYDPHHPAVLRLIKLVTENAHKNGIWVGICGELGADLALTETFLAMGLDELSVTPRAVLPLRNAVRMTDTRESAERLMAELDADYTAR